ncbi:hypothetical protein FQA39_LY16269 [Lamprigera yunnana]|nr:hypothetical protein FQA39_LY16269 [Lamprigera yunnana]
MESLIGYGSDEDYDDMQPRRQTQDSNDSSRLDNRRQSRDNSKYKDQPKSKEKEDRDKFRRTSEDYRYEHNRFSPKHKETRNDKYKDKSRNEERRSRERDYKKDKSRYRDDHGRDRRQKEDSDRYKDNKDDRRSHRGSSRERHRSRSPRRSDYSKSGSYERNRSKRYERNTNKLDRLERLGIEVGASGSSNATTSTDTQSKEKDRFFMPGITGRFTEQIQRRKMLWQKKDGQLGAHTEPIATAPTQKVWQNTTFAQDNDGKVANKFKRLMGIRDQEKDNPKPPNDNLKKQEEMFTSMEAQYEVARTATHTMRGNCVMENLSNSNDEESKQKLLETFKRFHEEDVDLDSDDDAECASLNERLQNVDLDDTQEVWKMLSNDERQEFEAFLRSGEITKLIPKWQPWWTQQIPKVKEMDKNYPENCPKIYEHIKEFSYITNRKPAECVQYNLINIISAYVFTARYFNGDCYDFIEEAVGCISYLSLCLKENVNFESFCDAVQSVEERSLKNDWITVDAENVNTMKEDVSMILDDSNVMRKHYILSALSDIHKLLLTILNNNVRNGNNLFQNGPFYKVTKTDVKVYLKKIEYFLSFTLYFYKHKAVDASLSL